MWCILKVWTLGECIPFITNSALSSRDHLLLLELLLLRSQEQLALWLFRQSWQHCRHGDIVTQSLASKHNRVLQENNDESKVNQPSSGGFLANESNQSNKDTKTRQPIKSQYPPDYSNKPHYTTDTITLIRYSNIEVNPPLPAESRFSIPESTGKIYLQTS